MTVPADKLLYPEIAPLLAEGRRYCACRGPSWEVEPEHGYCRVCGLDLHPAAVREMQARANGTNRAP